MRKDAAENQREILSCARNLIEKEGASRVSMNQIAKAAGVGAGTLYRHFKNKSTLCLSLVYQDLEEYKLDGERILKEGGLGPERKFHALLARYLDFREKNQDLLRAVEGGQESPGGDAFYGSALYEELCALFEEALTAAGHARAGDEALFQADMILAMLRSDSYLMQRERRGLSKEQICARIERLFLG